MTTPLALGHVPAERLFEQDHIDRRPPAVLRGIVSGTLGAHLSREF